MTHRPSAEILQQRLGRATRAAATGGVDALFLTPGADLRYLTGYDALPLERLTCLVLPARGDPVLVVPRLEHAAPEASDAGGPRRRSRETSPTRSSRKATRR